MSDFFKHMEQEPISFSVGTGSGKIIFHMRVISVAEELKLRQRWTALTDEEKGEKNFEINVDALANYSIRNPVIEKQYTHDHDAAQDRVEQESLMKGSSPAEAVRNLFSTRSNHSERYAETAVRMWLLKLQLDASFL